MYRLIVGEKRDKLNGSQVEDLGWYNPHTKKSQFNGPRITHWVKMGAQPTETVTALLKKASVVA